jgi:hypothetical protein
MSEMTSTESAAPAPTGGRPAFRGDRLKVRKAAYVGKRHNGDELAVALIGMTPKQVVAYASHKLNQDLAVVYAKLNDGQKRMNSANRLRGAINRGEVALADVLREMGDVAKLNRQVVKGEKVVANHLSTAEALRVMATLLGRTYEELVEAGADLGNPGVLADGTEVSIDYCTF